MDFDEFLAVSFTTIILVLFIYIFCLLFIKVCNDIRDISRTYITDYISETDSVEVQPDDEENTTTVSVLWELF